MAVVFSLWTYDFTPALYPWGQNRASNPDGFGVTLLKKDESIIPRKNL